jgi:hypothetical protein
MTLREKQRLRRIIESNSAEYAQHRRNIVRNVMNGTVSPETQAEHRRWLVLHAQAVAEASVTLYDNGEAAAKESA